MALQAFTGFKFAYRLCGQPPTHCRYVFKDTETLSIGDLVNLESGTADLAATNDSGMCGVAQQTKAGITAVSEIEVINDWDAVYAVYDAVARYAGEKLDIAGATGAMTVATDSNHDVIVVSNSSAVELTYVMIIEGEHFLV